MLAHFCLKEGSGIPLVFLHGFLGTSSDWKEVCAYLPACHCIGVDLPGHGASPFTEHFVEEMPRFERFHLIGYSMGGRLALQFAEKHPARICSLLIASAHTGLTSEKEKKGRFKQDIAWAEKLLTIPFDEFLKQWYDQPVFNGFFPKRGEQDRESLAKALIHYSLGKQDWVRPENAFFAVGEKDRKYRELFPEAEVIPGAAHAVHLENPKALANWIERNIL